ncbi:CAP domain-containing protein [Roseobacter weihaiensis]|uniref:CAP domain-containing protein n=1 Tax=Roseobacter weihaiensis TaxID=2763262 RepID=UPI001D0A45F0|nr:CAP domain-containing protein [Roseobacter sp. H9]
MKRKMHLATVFAVMASGAGANPQATGAINELRLAQGLPALGYSSVLERAAQAHAADMAESGRFSHTGSDGSDLADRVSRTGYGWCAVAENIAKGQRTLAEVMAAWEASPGHRANLLSPEVTEFALIEAEGHTWVMVLGAPGC